MFICAYDSSVVIANINEVMGWPRRCDWTARGCGHDGYRSRHPPRSMSSAGPAGSVPGRSSGDEPVQRINILSAISRIRYPACDTKFLVPWERLPIPRVSNRRIRRYGRAVIATVRSSHSIGADRDVFIGRYAFSYLGSVRLGSADGRGKFLFWLKPWPSLG